MVDVMSRGEFLLVSLLPLLQHTSFRCYFEMLAVRELSELVLSMQRESRLNRKD